MLQPTDASKVHLPSESNINGHRQSLAIKRRHMTFAEAEKERSHRVQQLALLGPGDIIGLDSYVCDLSTYMNSARCTAPCDLFYILKHNFLRLQKRHGTQGLAERLREIVRLSLHAYPPRILQLPLYATLSKKQLAAPMTEEQQHQQLQQNNAKQPWLLHANNGNPSVR
jgi:CRP-like cAMP-binding protein